MSYSERLQTIKDQFSMAETLFQECIKHWDIMKDLRALPKSERPRTSNWVKQIQNNGEESKKNYECCHVLLDDAKNEIIGLIYDLQGLDIKDMDGDYFELNAYKQPLEFAMKEMAFISAQDRRLFYNYKISEWTRDSEEKLGHIFKDHTKSHFERIKIVIDIVEATI